MISLLIFVVTVVLTLILVRVGTIALEITGVPREHASFQALSAYTGVGFTTKESEFVINNAQRRNVIRILMRLGSLGIISSVAALAGTLVSSRQIWESLLSSNTLSFGLINLPQLILILLALLLYGVYRALSLPATSRLIQEVVSQLLMEHHMVAPVMYEEVMVNQDGYGIVQVDVCPSNPLNGVLLREANLEGHGITVLSVERPGESFPYPSSLFRVQEEDRVVCFGPLQAIKQYGCAPGNPLPKTLSKTEEADAPLPVGTMAPPFALWDQEGKTVSLEDYRGQKNLLIVFYPRDKTPVCSATLQELGYRLSELQALETEVVAINPQSSKSHQDFARCVSAHFPILSDGSKKVSKSYKALMLGGLLINRSYYLVDKAGVIRLARRGKPRMREVLQTLRVLQEGGLTSSSAALSFPPAEKIKTQEKSPTSQ